MRYIFSDCPLGQRIDPPDKRYVASHAISIVWSYPLVKTPSIERLAEGDTDEPVSAASDPYSTRMPLIARAITSCWISLVPSKIV